MLLSMYAYTSPPRLPGAPMARVISRSGFSLRCVKKTDMVSPIIRIASMHQGSTMRTVLSWPRNLLSLEMDK